METKNQSTSAIPDELASRYSKIRTLGSGAMGDVFRAHDAILNKDVAIKVLKRNAMSVEAAIRFQQEARTASKLKHQNLVTLMDFGISDKGGPYLIMESVEGKSLSAILDQTGRFPIPATLNIMIQICDGMEHAHRNGVVHRDLKPSNVLVCGGELATAAIKVLDFGIAKLDSATAGSITQTGTVLGTPYYMSPEQFSGSDNVDRRADVYAAGCIMFRLLTNHHPFEGESLMEIMQQKQNEVAPLISDVVEVDEFFDDVEQIVERCLETDPAERYQTMAELKEALLLAFEHLNAKVLNQQELEKQIEQSKTLVLESEDKAVQKKSGEKRKRTVICASLALLSIAIALFSVQVFNRHVEVGLPDKAPIEKVQTKTGTVIRRDSVYRKDFFEINPVKKVWEAKAIVRDRELEWMAQYAKDDIDELRLGGAEYVTTQNEISPQGYAAIGRIPLKVLVLTGSGVTDGDMPQIARISTLKHLDVMRTSITDKGVRALTNKPLVGLNLSTTSVTDACIPVLATMNLHRLNLSCTKVSDDGLRELASAKRSNMESINLQGCDLTDTGMQYVAKLKKVNKLTLGHTRVGYQGLAKLAGLKLNTLSVDGDKRFDDRCLELVAQQWPDIESLNLNDTVVTGAGLKQITKLKRLRNLCLNALKLQDNDVLPIVQSKSIQGLYLTCNDITDKTVEGLARMPQLKFVEFNCTNITNESLKPLLARRDRKELDFNALDAPEKKETANSLIEELYYDK